MLRQSELEEVLILEEELGPGVRDRSSEINWHEHYLLDGGEEELYTPVVQPFHEIEDSQTGQISHQRTYESDRG